jgi:hypothetical protein
MKSKTFQDGWCGNFCFGDYERARRNVLANGRRWCGQVETIGVVMVDWALRRIAGLRAGAFVEEEGVLEGSIYGGKWAWAARLVGDEDS